jgi:hypothetical protein
VVESAEDLQVTIDVLWFGDGCSFLLEFAEDHLGSVFELAVEALY